MGLSLRRPWSKEALYKEKNWDTHFLGEELGHALFFPDADAAAGVDFSAGNRDTHFPFLMLQRA